MRCRLGQNIIEFLIILGLVSVGVVMALTILGGNVDSMFTASTNKVDNFDPFNAGKTGSSIIIPSGPPSETVIPPEDVVETQTLAGIDVSITADGDYGFSVDGQDVVLSSELLDLQNIALETSGSEGVEDLITELAYMIDKNKDDYPPGEVPIEIIFGDSDRSSPVCTSYDFFGTCYNWDTMTYKGTAQANSTVIKVGNEVVILVKDQGVTVPDGVTAYYQGDYRIEGTINPDNTFTGYATSEGIEDNPRGAVSANVDLTSGFELTNSNFEMYTDETPEESCYFLMGCFDNEPQAEYDWALDFTNPDQQFNI